MYGKIFDQIYDGSLRLNWKALITFQQMIVLCDRNGIVDMTPEAIHFRTGIPLDIITCGIELLEKEDNKSRSLIENGKRIIRLDDHRDWGWQIVNHEFYRDLASHADKREMARKRKQRQRDREKSHDVTQGHAESRMSRHTDTDANTDTDTKKKNTKKKSSRACQWPKDFYMTKGMEQYAIDHEIDPEKLQDFWDDFHDWALSKGAKYKDWNAAFRTRVRKAKEYGKQFLKPENGQRPGECGW